jgi:hypothetical protein
VQDDGLVTVQVQHMPSPIINRFNKLLAKGARFKKIHPIVEVGREPNAT